MAGTAGDDLCLELHYGCDLGESDVLVHLQSVLASSAPRMFATLEVHAHERDRNRLVLVPDRPTSLRDAVLARGTERGATYRALAAESPPPLDGRRFGAVLLRGRGAGTGGRYLSIHFDTQAPAMPIGSSWLWSNSIGVTVSTARVEGEKRSTWVQELAGDMARHPHFLWGAAYLSGEFAASNLDTEGGLRAIGRDVRRHLPGVYWLNLFGSPYVELIGLPRLRTAPAARVQQDGQCAVLQAYDVPEEWPHRLEAKQRLRHHLGDDLFFDRTRPERRTRAPDFGLAPLAERPPFQVFTADGETFTPLPLRVE